MKDAIEENKRLRRRNGELIIKCSELELQFAQVDNNKLEREA
jgi:hypothetical protein